MDLLLDINWNAFERLLLCFPNFLFNYNIVQAIKNSLNNVVIL